MWAAATSYQRKEGLGAHAKDSAAIFSQRKFGPASNTGQVQLGAEWAVLNLLDLIQVLLSPSPPPALCCINRNPAPPRPKSSIKAPRSHNWELTANLAAVGDYGQSAGRAVTPTLSPVLSRLCF